MLSVFVSTDPLRLTSRLQNSVRKTHRVIIVEECMRSGGIGASVSSWISENLLEELDHEVVRLSSQDVPTAYAKLLEDGARRVDASQLPERRACGLLDRGTHASLACP